MIKTEIKPTTWGHQIAMTIGNQTFHMEEIMGLDDEPSLPRAKYTEEMLHKALAKINTVSRVEAFHKTFGHPVAEKPTLISKERAALRIKLLQEELDELSKAIEEDDLVEVADALCDIQYVLDGAKLEFGMKDVFPDMFAEVHRSNMSKACVSKKEANETIAKYASEDVDAGYIVSCGLFIVYRTSDNKILKSINYSPANLLRFLK